MIGVVEAVAGHRLCVVDVPDVGVGQVLRCSQDLPRVDEVVPSPDGRRLAVLVGDALEWLDVGTMAAHVLVGEGAKGLPEWTTDGRLRVLVKDATHSAGQAVRTCRVDGGCTDQPLNAILTGGFSWRGDELTYAAGDGVYRQALVEPGVDVPAAQKEGAPPEADWPRHAAMNRAGGAVAGPPGPWAGRTVWLGLDGGVLVVRDQTGVVVRLPGDIARTW